MKAAVGHTKEIIGNGLHIFRTKKKYDKGCFKKEETKKAGNLVVAVV